MFKKILVGFLLLFLVVSLGFVVWGSTPASPMPEAMVALTSDSQVEVSSGNWLVFKPTDGNYQSGYIFYPGGRVDYRAYAPYAHAIAGEGYLVVIPRMPLNLAVFGINTADKVITAFPEVKGWVIGGHSLGGSMAANYVSKNSSEIDGLVLLASYPASSDDLSNFPGQVVSISATLDGLATPEKIEASQELLPSSTRWVVIDGGNHAYFGWYGDQKGDNEAKITREEEQSITIQSSLDLLNQISR